jgi:deoxyribodipyrimidine photo-lyase
MTSPTIVWLRRDLRLHDQAAFLAAAQSGNPVIPVYVLDDETPKHRRMGAASRWWLHHSLARLDADLRALGSRLVLRRGKSDAVLAAIRRETGARVVHALHHYEPWWRLAERAVAKTFDLRLHHGNFLLPPGTVTTGSGQPYKIYTPFWRASLQQLPPPRRSRRQPGWPRRSFGRRAIRWTIGTCCRPRRTGQVAFARPGRRAKPEPGAPGSVCRARGAL